MARPQTRTPRSTPPKPSPAETPEPLGPAPGNGQPFSLADQPDQPDQAPAKPRKAAQKLQQLGVRIPVDLYERLTTCAEETDVPLSRLVRRAIEAEVTRLEQQR